MEIGITYEGALKKASPRLRRQIQWSVDLLRKAEPLMLKYDVENGAWVGFSGGKDSQALYHIAQLSGVKFKAFFSPTSIDPPQVIRFIRSQYPEVEFTPLKESIFTAFKRLKILPSMRVRWCCALFKEKGGENKVTLTGVRKAESVKRSKRNEVEVSNHKVSGNIDGFEEYSQKRIKRKIKNINQDQFSEAKENEVRCIDGKDKIIINPIINWTDEDVWEFLNKVVEVPHCELYDEPYNQTRIGCIGCPMAATNNQRKSFEMFPHVKERWIKAIMELRKEAYDDLGIPYNSTSPQKTVLGTDIASAIRNWGGGKSSVEDYTERHVRNDKHLRTWCEYGERLREQCKFSESVIEGCSTADALYDEQNERRIAEYIFDWWVSKKPFDQWFSETFLQQRLDFEEDINQLKQNNMATNYIGKKVVVRGTNSGVFFGTLAERNGQEVRLTDVRRLWYWDGAASDFQLAAEGVKAPAECKFTMVIAELEVLDAIELLPCTEEAIESLSAVSVWKR